jgi:hypothetical protein
VKGRVNEAIDHSVGRLVLSHGQLSFDACIAGTSQRIWFRTDADVMPTADAALVTCVLPAMRSGGTLTVPAAISPRILRTQPEFQAIQRAWSLDWQFGYPPLQDVEVSAPARVPSGPTGSGRVAAFFSGGVDSWSTILHHPELTDLIFVRGIDLLPDAAHQTELADVVEARLQEAAAELGLPLHVVSTNIRELGDRFADWETYYGCALVAVALFLAPLFERVLIAGDSDYEVQVAFGANRMVDQLWSTEHLEIVDDGGRFSRVERVRRICDHPIVRRTLRVCWENREGAYNCGRCRKCLMTMLTLEALGARDRVETFPNDLDLSDVEHVDIAEPVLLTLWEDVLDAVRAAGRVDLEQVLERAIGKGKRQLGLPATYRRRHDPGPPPSVRIAVIVPVWRQPQFLAGAIQSALDQEISVGVGVVIVNDGCPFASTDRIGRTFRDANPERVAYVSQPNRGLSSARNVGVRTALRRWPHIEAIFPLDADNQLSPQTLARLWEVLEEDPDAAWATPSLELFGAETGEWSMPGPFLPYLQLFMNQSDAGSLVRRSVFEAGIAYDETMLEGYEDWEFFLNATLSGFRGVRAGRCGFRYRRRPHSMVADAARRDEEMQRAMRRRHHFAYASSSLTRREHEDAPRFALVLCDTREVLLTASCDLAPCRLPLSVFAERLHQANDSSMVDGRVPVITVLTTASALKWIETRHLLAGVLLRLQIELRRRRLVGLRISGDIGTSALEMTMEEGAIDGLSALALRTRSANEPLNEPETVLRLAARSRAPLPRPLSGRDYEDVVAELRSRGRDRRELEAAPRLSAFLEAHHIDGLQTTLPWTGASTGRVLLVLAPWLCPSDLHTSLITLLRAARERSSELAIHLVLTTRSVVEADAEPSISMFDTVTPLGGVDKEAAERVLGQLMSGADIVLHAGTPDGLFVLPRLEREERGRQAMLAATTSSRVGTDTPEFLAARCYEPFIDAFLATSPEAARALANIQVVPDKISVVSRTSELGPEWELDRAPAAVLAAMGLSA